MEVRHLRLFLTLAIIVLVASFTDARRHNRRHSRGGRNHWRRHQRQLNAHRRQGHPAFGQHHIVQQATAKRLKDRTITQINHSIFQITNFFASLSVDNSPKATLIKGSPVGPRKTRKDTPDKVRHVMRPRLLQSTNNSTPAVITGTDPGIGFRFILTNFFGNPNKSVFMTSQLYGIHQTYDLRTAASNNTNSTNMTALLSFQSNGFLVPNQLTLMLPSNYNLLNFQFSKSCVFPVVASSPSLPGINSTTGKVDSQTARYWLQILADNAFEVFATQLAFGGLNSGVNGNVTVQFPNFSKDAATAQRLYSQELYFADKLPSIRLVQIYCPIIDSADGSWSVNVTGSVVTGPIVTPSANTTNNTSNNQSKTANSTTNATNGTNTTNGVVDTSTGNNTSNRNPDSDSPALNRSSLNKTALIVGLVLGSLLLIAIIAIVYLCFRVSKKRQEIITDEGYGPDAGFKQFDVERKVASSSSEYPTNGGPNTVQTTNNLPVVTEKGDRKVEGDAGFGWRDNEPIVIAEDDHQSQKDPFGNRETISVYIN